MVGDPINPYSAPQI